jgi:transcriptional regulator with XRE-family HTH domain
MPNTAAFGRWLRELRSQVEPELSQAELARQAGVSKNYVSRLERMADGASSAPIDNPSEGRIDALARVLEKYHRRPLINEARMVIGFPRLADEAPVAEDGDLLLPERLDPAAVIEAVEDVLRPENQDLVPFIQVLRRFSPRKRADAYRILKAFEQRPKWWVLQAQAAPLP